MYIYYIWLYYSYIFYVTIRLFINSNVVIIIYNNVEIWRNESSKKKLYGAEKLINIWDGNVVNMVASKLIETKTNSKYSIGYLGKVITPLILILCKMSGYIKTFKVKDGGKNNKLTSFYIDEDNLWGKNKTFWTKIENLKSITAQNHIFSHGVNT